MTTPAREVHLGLQVHRKQAVALDTKATEVLYGGAAGGGKSHLLRIAAVTWANMVPGLQVYLFRRQLPDLVKNHLEGPKGFRALLAPFVAARVVEIVEHEIRFPNGAKINASRMDEEFDGIATGLSAALLKDGQQAAAADQPMGGFKHTNVAVAGARNQYAAVSQVQDGAFGYAAAGGTANAPTLTLTPAITAYAAGQTFRFLPVGTNTGAATLAVSGLSAKAIKKAGGYGVVVALDPGDLQSAVGAQVIYDGTQFLLLSPPWSERLQANLLDNPMGEVCQRGSTSTADDTYGGCDRWYSLTQSNAITASQGTDGEAGTPFFDRINQDHASAQRMGRATILESAKCRHLRGQSATLQMRVRLGASANLRIAIVEWTGTADSVTSDLVNDWTSGTYTGGNFFLGSNVNVLGVAQLSLTANTWTDTAPLTVTVGAAMNNLLVVYWTEGTVAQNVKLDASQRRLVAGNVAGPFVPREYGEELRRCQRYYQKVQCTTAGGGGGSRYCMAYASSTTVADCILPLVVPMRLEGQALTLVTDGTAADYRVRRTGTTVACSVVPALNTGIGTTLNLVATVAAGLTAGEGLMLEATNTTSYLAVSAEL